MDYELHDIELTKSEKADVISRLQKLMNMASSANAISEVYLLKAADDRNVFRAVYNCRPVIIKQFTGPKRQAKLEGMLAGITAAQHQMSHPHYRVNTCLNGQPEQGIAMLSLAKGETVASHLQRSNPIQRQNIIANCAKWHQHFIGNRTTIREFSAPFWLKKLNSLEVPQMQDYKMDILFALVNFLKSKLADLNGKPIIVATCHGDFSVENLMFDGTVMTGVDIQKPSPIPVSQDNARFLVWLNSNYPQPNQPLSYGMFVGDKQALISSGLEESESEFLNFFIGYQLFARIKHMRGTPHAFARLEVLVSNYFESFT